MTKYDIEHAWLVTKDQLDRADNKLRRVRDFLEETERAPAPFIYRSVVVNGLRAILDDDPPRRRNDGA